MVCIDKYRIQRIFSSMATQRLEQLAEIISGFTFRKSTKLHGQTVRLIQANNVRKHLIISPQDLDFITLGFTNQNATTKKGDVILTSRGSFRAGVIDSDKSIVATSSVFILRPKTDNIQSKFLAIYLNSSFGQLELLQISSGGSIPSLFKNHLLKLKVPVVSLEKQQLIIDFFENTQKQKQLLTHKINLIDEVFEASLDLQMNVHL